MGELFKLHCTNCGNPLEIPPGIDQFACGNCSVSYQVKRGGGIVSIVALMKDTDDEVALPDSTPLAEKGEGINTQETPLPIFQEREQSSLIEEEKPKPEEPARKSAPPITAPVWRVERETRPAWQTPPRKKPIPWNKYFVFLLVLAVILFLTNPSQKRHESAIGKEIIAYAGTVGGELGQGFGQGIQGQSEGIWGILGRLVGSWAGGVAEDVIMGLNIFQYNNYYLFSMMTLDDQVISFGILRFTIMVTPVEEWIADKKFADSMMQKFSDNPLLGPILVPIWTAIPQMTTPVAPSTSQSLDPENVAIPTSTKVPVATPTKTPPELPTPIPHPNSTPIPTETPFSLVTPPITNPNTTATPVFPYVIQEKHPLYLDYSIINPSLACSWMGVGGQIFDINNSSQTGLIIELGGILLDNAISGQAVSGTAQNYGASGYELPIANTPITSRKLLYIQVRDQLGAIVSDKIFFDTFDECTKNLILINFHQVR